jgi:hypothetical protein
MNLVEVDLAEPLMRKLDLMLSLGSRRSEQILQGYPLDFRNRSVKAFPQKPQLDIRVARNSYGAGDLPQGSFSATPRFWVEQWFKYVDKRPESSRRDTKVMQGFHRILGGIKIPCLRKTRQTLLDYTCNMVRHHMTSCDVRLGHVEFECRFTLAPDNPSRSPVHQRADSGAGCLDQRLSNRLLAKIGGHFGEPLG